MYALVIMMNIAYDSYDTNFSASEVTTIWRYTNVYIIIIIIKGLR